MSLYVGMCVSLYCKVSLYVMDLLLVFDEAQMVHGTLVAAILGFLSD